MMSAEYGNNTVSGERRRSLLLFVILLACYAYIFPRWADPNQNSRLDMVFAIVDDHTFQIDRYVSNTVDYAYVDGHYYSDKAPGVAFLGVPIYAALRPVLATPLVEKLEIRLASNQAFSSTLWSEGSGIQAGKIRFAIVQVALAFALAGVPSALLGVGMYRWLENVTPDPLIRMGTVLAYGLLSPAFAYAGALYGHQLAAAFLFGAFVLAYGGRVGMRPGRLAAIGALLAAAVVTEYPAGIVAVIIGIYTVGQLIGQRQVHAIVWVLLGGSPFIAGWLGYNTVVFGEPWGFGYSYSALWVEEHQRGFLSLTFPRAESIWGITFSAFRGLFLLSPILLLAMSGFLSWWRSCHWRAEWWVAATISMSMMWFNASSGMWWGGFAVGPRYLLPGLPFLALGLAFALRAWGSRAPFRWAVVGAGAWSWVATWGLTLAGQAFPSDELHNPLVQYALPNWADGNIARNIGTLLGLSGASSLLPLLGVVALLAAVGWGRLPGRLCPLSEPSASASINCAPSPGCGEAQGRSGVRGLR